MLNMKLLIFVLFFVSLTPLYIDAQVYLSNSGSTAWSGVCDNTCTLEAPCTISGTISVSTTSSCSLVILEGSTMPNFQLNLASAALLTLSTTGLVTISPFTINAPSVDLRFVDFISTSTVNQVIYTLSISSLSIVDSDITGAGNNLFSLPLLSSSLNVTRSRLTNPGVLFTITSVTSGAVIRLDESHFVASTFLIDAPGNIEIQLFISNCTLQGSFFLSLSHLEVINSFLTIISSYPDFFFYEAGTISSGNVFFSNSSFTGSLSYYYGIVSSSSVFSPFTMIDCTVQGSMIISINTVSSNLILIERLNYTSSLVLNPNIRLNPSQPGIYPTITVKDSNFTYTGLPTSFSFIYYYGASIPNANLIWQNNRLNFPSFTEPSAVNPMQFASNSLHFLNDILLPKIYFSSGPTTISAPSITFTGGIYGTDTLTLNTSKIIFESIPVESSIMTSTPESSQIIYRVTKPEEGITIQSGSTLNLPSNSITIQVIDNPSDEHYDDDFPQLDVIYPLVNGLLNDLSSINDLNNEFNLSFSYNSTSHQSTFTFHSIECNSGCVVGHFIEPCLSNLHCNCTSDWSGDLCDISLLPPQNPPIANPITIPTIEPLHPTIEPSSPSPSSQTPPSSSTPTGTSESIHHFTIMMLAMSLMISLLI
jgi:hypothetical protein